jgi:uncharacterized protein (DUF488 family)
MPSQEKFPFPDDQRKDSGGRPLPGSSTPILTIGHSTHSMEAFVELLLAHGVKRLVDVRSFPRSRRNPHFNHDVLPGSLKEVGIEYRHVPGLGGFRRPRPDSKNLGRRTKGFRGYAEAVYLRCHHRLIADALLARGLRVDSQESRDRRRSSSWERALPRKPP